MSKREPEYKVVALDQGQVDDNSFAGIANMMGIKDLGDDVVFPGFFRKALPAFRKQGFIPVGHKWDELPVAYPTSAEEVGKELRIKATFHTTQAGQDARTVVKERTEAGLNAGLSVGYVVSDKGEKIFPHGDALLKHAEGLGISMSLFDTDGIRAHKTVIRGLLPDGCDELVETSVVPAPMNQQSTVTSAKGWKSRLAAQMKTVCGATDLKLADKDHAWDAAEAKKRIKEAMGDGSPDEGYARAFMVCEGDAKEFGSYKLPFADWIDGQLKAVFKGIEAVAGALDGARGGVALSDEDKADVKKRVEGYYARARKEFDDDTLKAPWDDKKDVDDSNSDGDATADEGEAEKQRQKRKARTGMLKTLAAQYKSEYLDDAERGATVNALYSLNNDLMRAVYKALYVIPDDAESMASVVTALGPAFDEFKTLCMKTMNALLADVDLEELSEDSGYYYYYYSAPPAEQKALMLMEKGRWLATAMADYVTHASRRQDARVKSGRRLSQESLEQMQQIHDHMMEGCKMIEQMMAGALPQESEPDGDEAKERLTVEAEVLFLEAELLGL